MAIRIVRDGQVIQEPTKSSLELKLQELERRIEELEKKNKPKKKKDI